MISIIVVLNHDRVIGKGNDLPWKLSEDLKHFAKITRGHPVIMGRKTYESIVKRLGHGLPDRTNIVITSQSGYAAPGCVRVSSVDRAIEMFEVESEEVFVIGGGEIYKQFLPVADKLYLTEVAAECDGDTFFPAFNKEDWEVVSYEPHSKDERNVCDFTFLELVRRK